MAVYLQQRPDLTKYINSDVVLSGFINKPPTEEYIYVSPHSVKEVESESSDKFLGYGKREISKEKLEGILNRGCSWCASPVKIDDASSVHFISEEEFLCADCMQTDEVRYYMNMYH